MTDRKDILSRIADEVQGGAPVRPHGASLWAALYRAAEKGFVAGLKAAGERKEGAP